MVESCPPYISTANYLREAIDSSVYKDGEKLPSYKELAEFFEVAVNTVKAAIKMLHNEGLVVVVQHGKGTFVNKTPNKEQKIRSAISAIRQRLSEIEQALGDM